MADPEHLALLRGGVSKWNSWRASERNSVPDLRSAPLQNIELDGADLSDALLDGANLSNCVMNECNFEHVEGRSVCWNGARIMRSLFKRSHFSYCDFKGSHLSDATFTANELTRVNFSGARLFDCFFAFITSVDCDFSGASIRDTQFHRSTLVNTDFSLCSIDGLVLDATTLVGSIGLDSVMHLGPSSIGIDSFFASGGLPDAFLRGAGVPELFVNYAASLTGTPIELQSCFISYSNADDEFARVLHSDMMRHQIRTWFAPHDLRIGDRFRRRIEESIYAHDKLLLVLSTNSIASPWVESEVEAAFERERKEHRDVLFPIMLDDAVMQTSVAWAADIRRTRHIGDFTSWQGNRAGYREALQRLLRDLRPRTVIVSTRGQ